MITINTWLNNLQNGLNANAYGIKFALFADGGSYKKAFKTRTAKTRYTNGLLTVGESSITPTRNLTIATQQVSLEVCVQLFNPETNDEVISAHRAALDAYFKTFEVFTLPDGDDVYTVSALYSLASTGTMDMRSEAGTSITFFVNITYTYIENGLNSYNCTFTLDGHELGYTSAKITKTPIAQSDAFSDSAGRATTVNTAFKRSFDFQIPAQADGELSGIIIGEIMGGGLNTPHTLVAMIAGEQFTYDVTFGETDISFEGISNAGQTISLVERVF
ncbi:MAG: hypothetical protein J1G01_04535 [Clostridiales bacterium]|nr:hypothetical protein [Clostridiales bacterium]